MDKVAGEDMLKGQDIGDIWQVHKQHMDHLLVVVVHGNADEHGAAVVQLLGTAEEQLLVLSTVLEQLLVLMAAADTVKQPPVPKPAVEHLVAGLLNVEADDVLAGLVADWEDLGPVHQQVV